MSSPLDNPPQPHTGIGVMSGTSLDGVDLVLCRFEERDDSGPNWTFEILKTASRPYSKEWRERLANAHDLDAARYARLDVEYGHLLGEWIAEFAAECPEPPGFAASHGHTIFHQPENAFTAQIGDGETIAAHLAFPVVCNFRNQDVALGGQGAPLVPFGERLLFPDCRLFLNLGGFSNLTADHVAFDVAPCNFALNRAARFADPALDYDPDGRLAQEGRLDSGLLEKLNRLDYYGQPPPKSLGREWFERHLDPILREYATLPRDLLHTLCRHVAIQIGSAVRQTGIRDTRILVTGGGARNTFLLRQIENELAPLQVTLRPAPNEVVDFKEALIFAFLGLHSLLGRPNTLPPTTGARRAAIAGSVHLPPP